MEILLNLGQMQNKLRAKQMPGNNNHSNNNQKKKKIPSYAASWLEQKIARQM